MQLRDALIGVAALAAVVFVWVRTGTHDVPAALQAASDASIPTDGEGMQLDLVQARSTPLAREVMLLNPMDWESGSTSLEAPNQLAHEVRAGGPWIARKSPDIHAGLEAQRELALSIYLEQYHGLGRKELLLLHNASSRELGVMRSAELRRLVERAHYDIVSGTGFGRVIRTDDLPDYYKGTIVSASRRGDGDIRVVWIRPHERPDIYDLHWKVQAMGILLGLEE